MAHRFTAILDNMISQIEEPGNLSITSTAQSAFTRGIDKINEYRGHPFVFVEAMRIFENVDSRPLFYAGIAYMYLNAAYREGFTYERDVLAVAQQWLDKALTLAPDLPEALVIQVYAHVRTENFGPANDTLDRLAELGPYSFYALCAKLEYYATRKQRQKYMETYQEALALALTTTRKAYLQARLAKYFLAFNMLDESINAYRELVKITPNDPWLWHNLSLIYLRKKRLIKAWRCNTIALKIMEFGNARRTQDAIHRAIERRAIGVGVLVIFVIVVLGTLLT